MANLPKETTKIKSSCFAPDEKENFCTPNMKSGIKLAYSPFSKGSKQKTFAIHQDETASLLSSGSSEDGKKIKAPKARKSLGILQPTTGGFLAGQGRDDETPKKDFFSKKFTKKSKNSSATAAPSENKKSSTQKSNDESVATSDPDEQLIKDAIDLMKQTEKTPDSYWEKLAEERRVALEDALSENEKLYSEIDQLEEENKKLKQNLSDSECYKLLYKNLLEQMEQKEQSTTTNL